MFAPRWLCGLPLLGLVPCVLLLRRWRMLVPVGLAAVIIAGPVTGLCLPWRTLLSPAPSGPRLRVLTCNLHGSAAVDPVRLEAAILESGADVVALQEWPEAEASTLGTWPGWYRHVTPHLFLASQFPIREVTDFGLDSYGPEASVSRYDLETPEGLVHFFSLHLASPRDGIYETIHENRKGPAAVIANIDRRRQQSEYVARQTAALEGRVVLAGDFNTPPESAIFREVWGDYADAFSTAGWGWGYTFFGARTMVRIDHVLASKDWTCDRCRVGSDVGSPHRPVVAELCYRGSIE
jgi:endonuclease/exonuclease/phosphatase (EEP) superfamily protein YafD